MRKPNYAFVSLLALALSTTAVAAPIVFSVGGSSVPSSIQATVDSFRATLGDPNNGNAAGQPLGRREINWDGGGSLATTQDGTPLNTFRDTRGAQFTTPGTGFLQAPEEGGTDGGLAIFFAQPSYGATFSTFSTARLFTPVGSNVVDATFFVPGTGGGTPAAVGGFGAVFTDVDVADSTLLSFFDFKSNLLYSRYVPTATVADGGLSFLGVIFDAGEQIARVRIVSGNAALGGVDNPGGGVDLVVMDDFMFREPAAQVPEPATWSLVAASALVILGGIRRRRALPS